MSLITLTTDFGLKDGFIGTLKGVIWSICPAAQVADISHEISPQNVLEGAFILGRSYPFFPAGTIHVAVVDPGVGTNRRPIAIGANGHIFVGPDNGIFTPMLLEIEKNHWKAEIIHLVNDRFFLPKVSTTFHGRDIFAPVAAHLANGIRLLDLGPTIDQPIRIKIPEPERTKTGWRAHIISVDRFGNLATDLPADWIRDRVTCRVRLGSRETKGISETYGARASGDLLALTESEGRLELAVANGSAALVTGARVGDCIEVVE